MLFVARFARPPPKIREGEGGKFDSHRLFITTPSRLDWSFPGRKLFPQLATPRWEILSQRGFCCLPPSTTRELTSFCFCDTSKITLPDRKEGFWGMTVLWKACFFKHFFCTVDSSSKVAVYFEIKIFFSKIWI